MSDWSDFCDGANRFFDKATREAVRLGDSAAIYVRLKNLEARLDTEYIGLGRLTYRKLRRGTDNGEKIEKAMSDIDELESAAEALRAELEKLKNKNKS